MTIKVGLIGCGSIGTVLAKFIDASPQFSLTHILDDDAERCEILMKGLHSKPASVIRTDDMTGTDLIIEAASQECVRERGPKMVEKADTMFMSIGAFSDMMLFNDLKERAEKSSHRIYIPSGAIAGLDGIKAAAQSGLETVMLTTRKNPKSFEGTPWVIKHDIPIHSIKKPEIIFEGSAKHAAEWFPKNVNVSIALALAGIGPERTKVRIIADPFAERNIHEIIAEGKFGSMTVKLENNPSPHNQKTSRLASMSAIATLKKISETVQIGT